MNPTEPQSISLDPPAPLAAPAPVAVVDPQSALGAVKLPPDETQKLDGQVQSFARDLLSLDIDGDDFKHRVGAINTMASAEISQAASVSNRMLDRPTRAMSNGVFDGGSTVSKSLLDLRKTIEGLDPAKQGDLFSPRKLLGLIPLGSKLQDYFRSYESSQTHLNSIIDTLLRSKDELMRDNASIDQERTNMWALMGKLEQYSYLAQKLDDAISAKLDELDASDPARAKILREEALFYVRQKRTDIATQMAVNVQGYLALDLIRKNNLELQKGVDRATTTTVSALRTAIIVAQALANQKLVLDQISALNTTTGNLIASTSEMLKNNSTRVYQQASSSTVDIKQLQTAFDNVFSAIDSISTYKAQALTSMKSTVEALQTQIDRAQPYIDENRKAALSTTVAELPAGDASGIARIM